MAQAKQGDTVKVNYIGKLKDGTVFDTSEGREPLEFTLGQGQLIPGFEEAVEGMEPGQTNTVNIPAEKAYGPRNEDWIIEVEREEFPDDLEPAVGQQLQLRQENGQEILVVVTDVANDKVTLDANHPLAGHDLIFEIQLMEIA